MIRANQYYVLGYKIPATTAFEFNEESHPQELEDKFNKSALKTFAANWILFAINEQNGRVQFSKSLLATVYTLLIENKKLASKWRLPDCTNLNLKNWLEDQLS